MINYGFKDYQTNARNDSSVDTYNRFNDEVIKRDKNNLNLMAKQELEFYKDQRHKQFIQLCEINNENN